MSDDSKVVKEFQEQYIDTLVAVKAGLESLVSGQKILNDHLTRNSDEQVKQLASIAADIRVMREQNSNLQLKLMMTNPKDLFIRRNGENGNGNGAGNENSKDKNVNGIKDIKKHLDAEEELDRELMYRYVGRFITNNWKFVVVVLIIAVVGTFVIFGGHTWAEWFSKVPIKRP